VAKPPIWWVDLSLKVIVGFEPSTGACCGMDMFLRGTIARGQKSAIVGPGTSVVLDPQEADACGAFLL